MSDVFQTKLRKIGSSVGVLIPKEQLDVLHLGVGDEIEVALLKHRNTKEILREIERSSGIAKHFKEPFVRDKSVRDF